METMRRVFRTFGSIFLLTALCVSVVSAQSVMSPAATKTPVPSNPQAAASFEQAQKANQNKDYIGAAEAYRKVIELEPDFMPAHNAFAMAVRMAKRTDALKKLEEPGKPAQAPQQNAAAPATDKAPLSPEAQAAQKAKAAAMQAANKEAMDAANKELEQTYTKWIEQNPKKAVFQWGLAAIVASTDKSKAEKLYLKAVELDPKLTQAYTALATIAEGNGDFQGKRNYLQKAMAVEPQNTKFALDYALTFRHRDPVQFGKLVNDLVSRFPKDDASVQGLYAISQDTDNQKERRQLLERINAEFADVSGYTRNSALTSLFGLYAESDSNKALGFAEEMLKANPKSKDWQGIVDYQKNVVEAKSLIAKKDFAAATKLLDETKAPRGVDRTSLQLLKAEAVAGAGDLKKAYDDLAKLLAANTNQHLTSALMQYGKKLNKSARDVQQDLWQLRTEKAEALKNFELVDFRTGKPVRLADYRGRVVMVNFWFPG